MIASPSIHPSSNSTSSNKSIPPSPILDLSSSDHSHLVVHDSHHPLIHQHHTEKPHPLPPHRHIKKKKSTDQKKTTKEQEEENDKMASPINERAKEKQSLHYIVRSLLAGAVAGATAKTFVAPLDRVKILFQAHNPSVEKYRGHTFGVFSALREIVKQDGILGAYRGHSAILTRIMPYAGLNYMFYEQYKRLFLPSDPNNHGHFHRVLAGSCAGATAVFFTYPLDLIHSRMTYQIKMKRYTSITQTVRVTIEEEGGLKKGIRALYRGFQPTIIGILPYAGVSFSTYDTLKTLWLKGKVLQHKRLFNPNSYTVDGHDLHNFSHIQLSIYEKLFCGALAGACAQTASYPLDVVRRRMQLKGLTNEFHYKSTWDGLKTIWRVEGWRGFFVGLSINYLKVGPSHAISFATYEYIKSYFGIH